MAKLISVVKCGQKKQDRMPSSKVEIRANGQEACPTSTHSALTPEAPTLSPAHRPSEARGLFGRCRCFRHAASITTGYQSSCIFTECLLLSRLQILQPVLLYPDGTPVVLKPYESACTHTPYSCRSFYCLECVTNPQKTIHFSMS